MCHFFSNCFDLGMFKLPGALNLFQNGLLEEDPEEPDIYSHPHVLAVLQHGYTRQQIQSAFDRYGNISDLTLILLSIFIYPLPLILTALLNDDLINIVNLTACAFIRS